MFDKVERYSCSSLSSSSEAKATSLTSNLNNNHLTVPAYLHPALELLRHIDQHNRSGMPRVVADQRTRYDQCDLFKQLSIDSPIAYVGNSNLPAQNRKEKLLNDIAHHRLEIAFTTVGINIQLCLSDFADQPDNTMRLTSDFILNGVCVTFIGKLSTDSFDGVGRIEYDERRALIEEERLQVEMQQYREFMASKQMHSAAANYTTAELAPQTQSQETNSTPVDQPQEPSSNQLQLHLQLRQLSCFPNQTNRDSYPQTLSQTSSGEMVQVLTPSSSRRQSQQETSNSAPCQISCGQTVLMPVALRRTSTPQTDIATCITDMEASRSRLPSHSLSLSLSLSRSSVSEQRRSNSSTSD